MPESADAHRAIEAVWKIEASRVIAGLSRMLSGDVGTAEEFAQEALLAALEQWPQSGIPDNPGAWLMTTAKNRAVDALRRDKRFKNVQEDLSRESREREALRHQPTELASVERALDGGVEDDLLRLVFTACHPALPGDGRSALTLRLLCGLTTDEIARAFLVPEPTIAQRIVRAKKALADQRIAFEVPLGPQLKERLASVLEVVYLLFNEGYAATSGDDWMRPSLCDEAVRLGRVLVGLMPREPEVHGLVALMEIQASRTVARTDASGKPVLLLDQNRSLWDRLLIRRGLGALAASLDLGPEPGPYALQASIAACHARAATAEETDWKKIASLYADLGHLIPSPIIELNRGVAVGMAEGPSAGLEVVDGLTDEPALRDYHLLPSARGDLLFKLGRLREARQEFERAAELTRNERERGLLLERAAACGTPGDGDIAKPVR
jgi:RNA polymerase sigma factor (sigma-70 family)